MSNDYKPNEAAEKQQGQWSELQLWRMDRRFSEAMRRALELEQQQRDKAKDSK